MTMLNYDRLSRLCSSCGADTWGIARARKLETEAAFLTTWLESGRHGTMAWMEGNTEQRSNPELAYKGCKSILKIGINYYSELPDRPPDSVRVSRYVTRTDYHHSVKKTLYCILDRMRKENPDLQGRVFCDTAPVMEKAWARRAGIGWMGKNTNIIHREFGSWLFIGGIYLNMDVDRTSEELPDFCGRCHKCQDACPTGALDVPYEISADKCISYHTIENRQDTLPADLKLSSWIYGCDICQDVCPWNLRLSAPFRNPDMAPRTELHGQSPEFWEQLGPAGYKKLTRRTAMTRQKYVMIQRNLAFHKKEDGQP